MESSINQTNLFKRLNFFQKIKDLDEQCQIQEEQHSSNAAPTWQLEKKILYWTYLGHKRLGSPLKSKVHFENPNFAAEDHSKLVDFLITSGEINAIKGRGKTTLNNLEQKGFCEKTDGPKECGPDEMCYIITKDGLEMGAALWEFCTINGDNNLKLHWRYRFGYFLMLLSIYLIYIFAVCLLIFEVLQKINMQSHLALLSNSIASRFSPEHQIIIDQVPAILKDIYIGSGILTTAFLVIGMVFTIRYPGFSKRRITKINETRNLIRSTWGKK
ncbi:MAG: hypothetical protein WCV88_00995 [Patescibacteria group bacterium]